MSNSMRPHRQQPTRLPCPWDSPGKNTGVGCHFLLQCMHACQVASVVSSSVQPYGQIYAIMCQMGFPGGSDGQESACNVGDLGSIPRLGRSPGGGHGNSLWYSCLENPMDRGAWQATAHGFAELDTTECVSTCVKEIAGSCCITQVAQSGAL